MRAIRCNRFVKCFTDKGSLERMDGMKLVIKEGICTGVRINDKEREALNLILASVSKADCLGVDDCGDCVFYKNLPYPSKHFCYFLDIYDSIRVSLDYSIGD